MMGGDVRDAIAHQIVLRGGDVHQHRGAELHPVGVLGSLVDHVREGLPVGFLDGGEPPALGIAPAEDVRLPSRGRRRRAHEARHLLGQDTAGVMVQPLQRLANDGDGLAHLLHPDAVAAVDVGPIVGGDHEVQFGIRRVGMVPPEIPGNPRGPQHGAGDTQVEAFLRLQDSQPHGPLEEDVGPVAERLVVVDLLLQPVHHLPAPVGEAHRDVVPDTTYPHVLVGHPGARVGLEEVQDEVPVPHPIEERGHEADVLDEGGVPHDVGGQPLELVRHDPDVLGPRGDGDAQGLLHGHEVDVLPREARHVAGAVHEGDHLVVAAVLADLLDAAVQESHLRVGVHDDLPVDLHPEIPQPMGHGVLGPHVDPHLRHDGASPPAPPVRGAPWT